jgi:hypothetical protein
LIGRKVLQEVILATIRTHVAAEEILQAWERACSRRLFASRLAPTGLDLEQSIYTISGFTYRF